MSNVYCLPHARTRGAYNEPDLTLLSPGMARLRIGAQSFDLSIDVLHDLSYQIASFVAIVERNGLWEGEDGRR